MLLSKRIAATFLAECTLECNASKSAGRFCSAIARLAMSSVIVRIDSGGGCKYVASIMSNGIKGITPVDEAWPIMNA
jgi:hypothetical protein